MPTLTIRPGYDDLLREAGLDSFEALLGYRGKDEEITAIHPTRRVYRIEIGGRTFFLKQFDRLKPRQAFVNALMLNRRRSRLEIEVAAMEAFRAAGVRAADWAARGERRFGLGNRAGVLLVPELDGFEMLTEVAAREGVENDLSGAVAHAVRRMHEAGLVHRDLYAKHVFVRRDSGEGWQAAFIDLQRAGPMTRSDLVERVRDLATLNASTDRRVARPSERLRFLTQYLGERRGELLTPMARGIVRESLRLGKRKDCRAWLATTS